MLGFLVGLILLTFVLSAVGGLMEIFGEKPILRLIAILVILWLVSSFWYIILPIAAIVLIGYITYCVVSSNKAAEKERHQIDWLISDVRRTGFWNFICKGVTHNKSDTDKILNEIIKHPIIIDTNIWMESDFDCFWSDIYVLCLQNNQKIFIPASVYDEIVRLKKDYDQEKKFRARLALDRVMKFSNDNLLCINDIKKAMNSYAYADIDIITMCEFIECKTGERMYSLITNDKDLIVRTRHILSKYEVNGEERCKILSVGRTKYTDKWNEYKTYLKNIKREDVKTQENQSKQLENK